MSIENIHGQLDAVKQHFTGGSACIANADQARQRIDDQIVSARTIVETLHKTLFTLQRDVAEIETASSIALHSYTEGSTLLEETLGDSNNEHAQVARHSSRSSIRLLDGTADNGGVPASAHTMIEGITTVTQALGALTAGLDTIKAGSEATHHNFLIIEGIRHSTSQSQGLLRRDTEVEVGLVRGDSQRAIEHITKYQQGTQGGA